MAKFSEKIAVYLLLIILFVTFVIVVFKTQNSFGDGDHFGHFNLAFWGWQYPDLLFNHWGKPVFTILISPFAQLGMWGARLYNVITGLATAYFCWLLARHFNFRPSWVVLPLVVFTPIYFVLMFTSLTEVTFSFFLVISIFLFFKEKYIWSAIVLSFLPLVRNEGIILIPLFFIAYSLKRQFLTLPFLALGFLIISFLGWPFYNSFWWLITEMPYSGSASDIYGSGTLLHFIDYTPHILSKALGWLFVAGAIVQFVSWAWKDKGRPTETFYFILLVVGSFVGYFAAHSVLWWKGMGNSLGLIRVIGSVTPIAALTAMAFISLVFSYRSKWWAIVSYVALFLFLFFFIKGGIKQHSYGFHPNRSKVLLGEAASYIKSNKLDRHKIYYYDGFIAYILKLNPRDFSTSQHYLSRDENFLGSVPDSSIIVWDAHFGPNEGRMPLQKLKDKKELSILKTFKPEEPFIVLGGHDYQVTIFQKDLSLKAKTRLQHLDFEEAEKNSIENVFKGSSSFKLASNFTYKNLLDVVYQEVSDTLSPSTISCSIAYYYPTEVNQKELLFVCTLETPGDVLSFEVKDMVMENTQSNTWVENSFEFQIPKPNTLNDQIKVYIWNKGGHDIFLDEAMVKIQPLPVE